MVNTVSFKPYYRAVVLVLASDNTPLYQNFRKVYQAYLDVNPNIKVFLVYGNQYSFIPQEHDLVFDDVEENYYPGMITKTIRAFEYVESNYDYDFLVRTNISTFWDFNRLLKRLDKQPKDRCITGSFRQCPIKGGGRSPHYVSGVNLVLSKDLVQEAIKQQHKLCSLDLPEDWALSQIFIDMGLPPRPSIPGAIHFMEKFTSDDETPILNEIEAARKNNHDHFRIKNESNRDVIDMKVASILLKEYYGKTIL